MNPNSQRYEKRFGARLTAVETELAALKTVQPIGADSLSVLSGALGSASVTIPAGGIRSFVTTFTPTNQKIQQLNFAASLFVDNDDVNAYLIPTGSSLSTGQLQVWRNDWEDWASSNDSIGSRVYITRVMNLDTASHTYYYYIRSYYPKGGAE